MFRITTTYPRFQLKIHFPEAEMEQKVSELQIETSGPSIEINQKACYNELGMGDYRHFGRQIRENNYQKVLNSIARMAEEGDAVMNRAGLFKEEMIFSDLAKELLYSKMPELNVMAAPSARPEIHFHYTQEISWNQGGAFIKHHIRPPAITWQLGEVTVEYSG